MDYNPPSRQTPTTSDDPCVYCGESTAFGSGRFVNRVPASIEDEDGRELDGYACAECLSLECERCGDPTFEYEIRDGEIRCENCP